MITQIYNGTVTVSWYLRIYVLSKSLKNLQKSFFTPKTLVHNQTFSSKRNTHSKEWKKCSIHNGYIRVFSRQVFVFWILVLLFSFDVERDNSGRSEREKTWTKQWVKTMQEFSCYKKANHYFQPLNYFLKSHSFVGVILAQFQFSGEMSTGWGQTGFNRMMEGTWGEQITSLK